MALKKNLVTNNIECNYWRIVGYNVSLTGKCCQIFLVGYKDGKTRDLKQNIVSKNYMMKPDSFDNYIHITEGQIILNDLYGYLKTQEDFKDAEDC